MPDGETGFAPAAVGTCPLTAAAGETRGLAGAVAKGRAVCPGGAGFSAACFAAFTHSITEAAYLAERAVVFSPRPAQVIADRRIDLPRERSAATRTDASFVLETHILFEALERGGAT